MIDEEVEMDEIFKQYDKLIKATIENFKFLPKKMTRVIEIRGLQ